MLRRYGRTSSLLALLRRFFRTMDLITSSRCAFRYEEAGEPLETEDRVDSSIFGGRLELPISSLSRVEPSALNKLALDILSTSALPGCKAKNAESLHFCVLNELKRYTGKAFGAFGAWLVFFEIGPEIGPRSAQNWHLTQPLPDRLELGEDTDLVVSCTAPPPYTVHGFSVLQLPATAVNRHFAARAARYPPASLQQTANLGSGRGGTHGCSNRPKLRQIAARPRNPLHSTPYARIRTDSQRRPSQNDQNPGHFPDRHDAAAGGAGRSRSRGAALSAGDRSGRADAGPHGSQGHARLPPP